MLVYTSLVPSYNDLVIRLTGLKWKNYGTANSVAITHGHRNKTAGL